MHIYKSRFLLRGEVWYDHEPNQTPVDWIFYRQRSRPVPGAAWKYFYSLLLDLTRDREALLQQVSKSTAYKIRRARDKDHIVCECLHAASSEVLDCFEEAYNRFASTKGLPSLDRQLLEPLAQKGFLDISVAKDPQGNPLAYHAYYQDAGRSCLLHAVSLHQTISDSTARNAMGRANRYLFWSDIVRHQERGLKIFDFGGWYPGNRDPELLAINQFKEGFGGTVVREYNCERILSLKGWVVLKAAALLNATHRIRARRRAGLAPRLSDTNAAEAARRPCELSSVAEAVGAQETTT
jgi:hypothetical protein